jgi:four helix bundle protein
MVDLNNIIDIKAYNFALRVINAYTFLKDKKQEYVLSKQLLRSGTSIGANVRESKFAQSANDFINKLSIALKEANETQYWLELLHDSDFIDDKTFESIHKDAKEITAILVSIIRTKKQTV